MSKRCDRCLRSATWTSGSKSLCDEHLFASDGVDDPVTEDAALIWTDEPPTKEGWYWYRDDSGYEPGKIVEVEWEERTKTWWLIDRCYRKIAEIRANHQWAGPIPEPKERGDK